MVRSAGRLLVVLVIGATLTPAHAAGGTHTIAGRVTAAWQDPLQPGSESRLHLSLASDDGSQTPLRADEDLASEIASRAGQHITVSGTRAAGGTFHALSATGGGLRAPQLGAKPWRTLLCKFADQPLAEPATTAYFDGIMGPVAPGMDHFWRSLSFDQMNLSGSSAHNWLLLTDTRDHYFPGGAIAIGGLLELAQDCVSLHDTLVDFTGVFGMNIIVNDDFCACALGGGGFLSTGEGSRFFGLTWEGPIGFSHQAVFGQEMGHAYGIGWHSSGTGGTDANPYVSKWDVMSNAGGVVTGECVVIDATYGCVAQGTIAFHKSFLGWLPQDRAYLSTGTTQRITLHPLDALPASPGYLGASISIGGSSSRFYTVEVRRQAGYDVAVPDPSTVIIHLVNTALGERVAQVVDATPGTGTANDEDVRWDAGESFFDGPNGVAVKILSGPAADGSYEVEISGAAFPGAPAPLEVTAKKLKVKEGDGRATRAKLVVKLTAPADQPVTFNVKTKNGSAKGRKDYGKLAKKIRLDPGRTNIKLPLRIAGDSLNERNESFFVVFSKAAGAILRKAKIKVVILDDD